MSRNSIGFFFFKNLFLSARKFQRRPIRRAYYCNPQVFHKFDR